MCLGDVTEVQALRTSVGEGAGLEAKALFGRDLFRQSLAEWSGLCLAARLSGGGKAAAFEFIEGGRRRGVVVEFDESGRFREAVARLLFLRPEDVPVDDAGDQDEQAADPGGGEREVMTVKPGTDILPESASFAKDAVRQSFGQRSGAFEPGAQADDEDCGGRAPGGFLLK
jgi:hypothetical protein